MIEAIVDGQFELVMFEQVALPARKKDLEGKWVPTGEIEYMTGYTFVDEAGNKIYFVSKQNEYRTFKGKFVRVVLQIEYNQYERKMRMRLARVEPVL